jgi:hypothetical protein
VIGLHPLFQQIVDAHTGTNNGWQDQRIAAAYFQLEAIQETFENGSTERGLVSEALSKLELADEYLEKRARES